MHPAPNAVKDPTNLGNVLSALMQVVPMDRLKEAVMRQMDEGGDLALGVVLVAMGAITQSDVDWALKIQEALRNHDDLQAKMLVIEYQTARIDRSLDRQNITLDSAEAALGGLDDEHH